MSDELELVSLREGAAELCQEAAALIADSDLDVEPPTCSPTSQLTIALVGPYNAGKSTIVAALTGFDGIPIGAKPTTKTAASYPWRADITLVDTPGVGTGRPDGAAHDDATERAVIAADQVVFVISDEGFDDVSAEYFKHLLPVRRVTGSLLLVVNKIGRTSATPEELRFDVERVLDPLTLDDQPSVFIDARSKRQAASSEDPTRRAQLLERSRWQTLLDALDDMSRRSGARAQAVQPLHGALSALEQLIVAASTTDPAEERFAVLLRRRERNLRHCQQQAARETTASIRAAADRIEEIGDRLADRIEPGSKLDFEAELKRADRQAEKVFMEIMSEQLPATIQTWITRAEDELDDLSQDPVLTAITASRQSDPEDPYVRRSRIATGRSARSVQDGMSRLGRFFAENSSAGEAGHRIVYNVGKALRIKFRPWGAVKATRFIGKIGRVMGPVMLVLSIVLEILDELQAHRARQRAGEARLQVRDAFASLAADAAKEMQDSVDAVLAETFGAALEDTAQMRAEQRESVEVATQLVDAASLLQDRIHTLIGQASR